MPKATHVLIAAAAGLSIGLLPIQFGPSSFGSGIAFANNGNGGGNGGGGNGGNGGGGGYGGGGGQGADNGQSAHGNAGGKSGQGGNASGGETSGAGSSGGGLLKALLRGGQVPAAKTEQKNLHARLGSLNSLKRNVHAYLSSNSPQMALVREYVVASAEAELAAEAFAAATEAYNTALAAFSALDGDPDSIENALEDEDLAALQDQMDLLTTTDTTGFLPDEVALYNAEVTAVQAAIDLLEAEAAVAAAPAPDPASLEPALIAAGNPNFQSDPIDADVLGWATAVIDGKIDDMKELLAAQ